MTAVSFDGTVDPRFSDTVDRRSVSWVAWMPPPDTAVSKSLPVPVSSSTVFVGDGGVGEVEWVRWRGWRRLVGCRRWRSEDVAAGDGECRWR
ncbi:MAG: hypothetical protein U5R31_09880 [Acidimicrobiia bacterium]|nr:hypothetical protein [Acidimicrobiia bacterium]